MSFVLSSTWRYCTEPGAVTRVGLGRIIRAPSQTHSRHLPRTPSLVIALISPTVLHTRPSLVLRCCHETVCYQEYYDEQGEFGFRPSQHTIEHPNGRGKVEKRVLQACLLQELR